MRANLAGRQEAMRTKVDHRRKKNRPIPVPNLPLWLEAAAVVLQRDPETERVEKMLALSKKIQCEIDSMSIQPSMLGGNIYGV